MADNNDKPDKPTPDVPGVGVPAAAGATPPDAGGSAGADAEKATLVDQAKARVAAVKESLDEKATASPTAAPAGPGAPRPPVKKKDEVHRMADANKAFAHYRF